MEGMKENVYFFGTSPANTLVYEAVVAAVVAAPAVVGLAEEAASNAAVLTNPLP